MDRPAKDQISDAEEARRQRVPGQGKPPFDAAALGKVLGEITAIEYLCPGVYFVTALHRTVPLKLGIDYYIVAKNSPVISAAAKEYGKEVPNHPELLSYRFEDEHSGRFVVEYEAYRYMLRNHMPLPEGDTLRETAMFGAESNPEYFGMFPVPSITPWGCTLRHKAVCNGVCWLEPERNGWVLGVHSLLAGDLSEELRSQGTCIQTCDDSPAGYVFFDGESGSSALCELGQFHAGELPSSILHL